MCWSRMRLNVFKQHLNCATGVLRNAASAPDTSLLSSMSSVEYTSLWCIKSSGSGFIGWLKLHFGFIWWHLWLLLCNIRCSSLLACLYAAIPIGLTPLLLHCCRDQSPRILTVACILYPLITLKLDSRVIESGLGSSRCQDEMICNIQKQRTLPFQKCGSILTFVAPVGKNNKRESSSIHCRRCRVPCQCK